MRYSLLLAWVAAIAMGCTKPNPRSCADDLCTDQAFPFCDTNGALEGEPDTCIAVSCAPSTFEACREDSAITCNAGGNNYDVTICEHGCDPTAGCVGCLDDTQCQPAAPHCDLADHQCRGCESDVECSSMVCERSSGRCADPTTLIYAAPSGSTQAGCGSQQMPCSIDIAFSRVDQNRNVIKLASGDYTMQNVTLTSRNATVLGSGAVLHQVAGSASELLHVTDGAHLFLEDLSIAAQYGIACDTTTSFVPAVDLNNVTMTSDSGVFALPCNLTAIRTTFVGRTLNASVAITANPTAGNQSLITLERTSFRGATFNIAGGTKVLASNCVFDSLNDTGAYFLTQGTTTGEVTHSTFVNSRATCSGQSSVSFSNNVFFATGSSDAVGPGNCSYHYGLMSPQSAVPLNSDHLLMNVDPLLISLPSRDFHLRIGSPAIDAANPASFASIDFEGTTRPQGPRADIGAFEYKP